MLVGLLTGMEEMHYPARRELASWLRQWIVRIQERDRVEPRFLDWLDVDDDAFGLAAALVQQPTTTYGAVEQRLVDAVSLFLHPQDSWSSRGRRDSVFASNLSRRKTGDWNIRIIFVAHEVDSPSRSRQVFIDDFSIDVEVIDYRELLTRAQLAIDARDDGVMQFTTAMNSDLIGALNEHWVPQRIRDRVLLLTGRRIGTPQR